MERPTNGKPEKKLYFISIWEITNRLALNNL